MKTLSANQLPASPNRARDFESAKALAFSMANSSKDFIEPELIAWNDRTNSMESPVLEGCSDSYAWHDYGVSHGGSLEVDINGERIFIFAESSPFDSYDHFGKSPFISVHDAKGNELICLSGGGGCVSLDEWTSKLT